MKFTHIIILTALLSAFNSTSLNAQNTDVNSNLLKEGLLKGLTKANEQDLSNTGVVFDGESIPIYDINGKRIRGNDLMDTLMSGDYMPDFYMDNNKDVKLAVLRIATKEEKKMMEEMQGQMDGSSELIGTDASFFFSH